MRAFGHLERDVMRAIWQSADPLTGHQVAAKLSPQRDIAYTTLITVVERLREKGLLTRVRDGRSYRYRALVSADDYAASLMTQVLEDSANRQGALLRFAGQLDGEEAATLRAALEEATRGTSTGSAD